MTYRNSQKKSSLLHTYEGCSSKTRNCHFLSWFVTIFVNLGWVIDIQTFSNKFCFKSFFIRNMQLSWQLIKVKLFQSNQQNWQKQHDRPQKSLMGHQPYLENTRARCISPESTINWLVPAAFCINKIASFFYQDLKKSKIELIKFGQTLKN